MIKHVFLIPEGPQDPNPVDAARERVSRKLANAFRDIERALVAGQRDVAASKANFTGQELDQLMRELSQSILASGGKKK
jgi:hypothetical protein